MQERDSAMSAVGEANGGAAERPSRITATLTVSQREVLQELATKYKVSVAWLIRQAIDRFIEEASGGPKLPFDVR
jgi:hypothetical protein